MKNPNDKNGSNGIVLMLFLGFITFMKHNNNAPETKAKKYELHIASTGKKAAIEVKNITSADQMPFFLEIKYGNPIRRYPNMHLIAISVI